MSKRGYEIGRRNVFQDLDVPNADEHFVKAQLVFKIDRLMKRRVLKQIEAAELLGLRQPYVSKMQRVSSRSFLLSALCVSRGARSGC